MKNIVAWILCAVCALYSNISLAGEYVETTMLAERVANGDLPSVAERLPTEPRVIDLAAMGREPGRHGGNIRMLMGKQKDIRMMTVYSYARLVVFNQAYELVPDILAKFDVEGNKTFTFHLRKGHKWSDGQPFTAEDIRYAWEDVLNHPELGGGALPPQLIAGGKPPKFEVIDEHTVRFSWEVPNPEFLPALAAARALTLALPAHYLKQFHKNYASEEDLQKLAEANGARNWRGLHIKMSRQYRPENPELPTLDPWRNTIEPPSEQFVFERNPYFHRVDENGLQLPYADKVTLSMGSTGLIPAKTGAGDSDLQARYLRFDNYTFLKEAEKQGKIKVSLWRDGKGSQLALLPNLNTVDEAWRLIVRDVRFRRALSLAIDRIGINQAVYLGLASESADTIIAESPLFKPEYQEAWSEFDPDRANALLDEMGLEKRNGDSVRLLPNGQPANLIVETSGEGTEQTDLLELIADYYQEIGIKLFIKTSQRDILRKRAFAGQTVMSVWSGIDNALVTPAMSPAELAPTSDSQLQWPLWGNHNMTHGKSGEAPDLPEAKKLIELFDQWSGATNDEDRARIWHEMLAIYTDQVYSIGTVNGVRQPVTITPNLKNVPEEGVFSYAPGAYFGVYNMDTFWFAGE
jgi:peptide/nickel transport system substrate-binding protein